MSEMNTAAPEAAPATAPSQIAPATEVASPVEGANENQPDQSGESDEKAEKPRQRASERIGEIYGRMKNAERARDLALAEVERLRQPVVDVNRWDELTYEQQQTAQMRQAVRAERADELTREAQVREYEAHSSRVDMFKDRLTEAKASIPDIEKAISDPSLPVTDIGARFIHESEKGPQVAYWLATNRDEASRIARLDPYSQAFELGKIEARIGAAPASRRLSNAPAPVPKVGGGSNSGAKDPSSMSMSEYAEWYRKRG
jgi:hypothetical protein